MPTVFSGSGIGIAGSGISNSTVRLTYHLPSAARRNVALLVDSTTSWLRRIRTEPILGITTASSTNLTRWGIRNRALSRLRLLNLGSLAFIFGLKWLSQAR